MLHLNAATFESSSFNTPCELINVNIGPLNVSPNKSQNNVTKHQF